MHDKTIKISPNHSPPFCLNMKLVYIALFVVPACTGFFAQIRDRVVDHFEQKLKRPECHVEWEDVTTPHCETHHEQVLRSDVESTFLAGDLIRNDSSKYRVTRLKDHSL